MRVVVTGADRVIGRGVAQRLVSMGHDVVGLGSRRPACWPQTVEFVAAETNEVTSIRRALLGADVVAHCTADGTTSVLAALNSAGTKRIVFTSSVVNARPADHALRARTERILADYGADWVAIRYGLVLGRDVDDEVLRALTRPVLLDADPARRLQVVHPHDVARLTVRAVTDDTIRCGTVDLVADGSVSVRDIAAALGRRVLRVPPTFGDICTSHLELAATSTLKRDNDYAPVWSAQECLRDFALVARGRIAVGPRVFSVPWRLPRVREIPTPNAPSADGVEPVAAGIPYTNGEFDTPVDPRFPAFVATNLSEALPGPFSPSSASVTVRGTRAAGMVIADRLRPGGVVQREMAIRTTGVFGHRLYAGLTCGYFMAQTVPLINPQAVVESFFGPTGEEVALFGADRPPHANRCAARQLRNLAVFGSNLITLSVGAARDTADFVRDIDGLEAVAADPTALDNGQLLAAILGARDHVVHGWVLSSASILVCTAYRVILRVLCGRDAAPTTGQDLASAQSLGAVHRLATAARRDAAVADLLALDGCRLQTLARHAPGFHDALVAELAVIGHRGPSEVEMRSASYADDPDLLVAMVAKTLSTPVPAAVVPQTIPAWAAPVAAAAAHQLRDRETRRDRMVRAIWLLRGLLREHGSRLVRAGDLPVVDDVFYLLVDELDAPPPDIGAVIAHRRKEQAALAALVLPAAFSRQWLPVRVTQSVLGPGESLSGLGVCGGRVRGRVRVIAAETIGDLQPGEVLVAKATDIGYTPAFAYAAAVVTELGGPLSHTAIVAREYGFPCVVGAREATSRLASGSLIEVDGGSGSVTVLEA